MPVDWIPIAVTAGSGALGAAVAYLIVRRPRQRPLAFLLLSLVLIAALHAAGRLYILDPLEKNRIDAELLQAISDIPVYQALREHDRIEYERLTGSLRQSLIAGRSRAETVARAQALLGGLINNYLPRAGDVAAARYVGVFTNELRQLRAHDADLCYRFVYPQDDGTVDVRAYVDEETRKADIAALAEVIRTAAGDPQPVPTADDVQADLMIVYQGLREVHGEDIALLGNPTAPDVDRAKICDLLTAFYGEVLELPEESGGRIIRYLFSDNE